MWTALRSDLKEFVSTVAEDTGDVLATIDSKLTDEERRRGIATPVRRMDTGPASEGGTSTGGGASAAGSAGAAADVDAMTPGGGVMIGEDGDLLYDGTGGDDGLVMAAVDEAERLRGLEDTYTEPLVPQEEELLEKFRKTAKAPAQKKGEGAEAQKDDEPKEKDDDDVDFDGDGWGDDEDVDVADEEKDKAIDDQAKETEEAVPEEDNDDDDDDNATREVKAFLSTFDIQSIDIAAVLDGHPDVKAHFENLVPTQVTYEQFWLRYYYRCDEDRIVRTWQLQAERARQARQEAINAGVSTVKNLFGGAVRALGNVSSVVAPQQQTESAPTSTGSSAYEKFQAEFKEQQRADAAAAAAAAASTGGSRSAIGGIGSALFGSGGRPPFVMNTAQDEEEYESDSADGSEEEEEEEEELGWSDDDDDIDDLDEEDQEGGDVTGEDDVDDDDDDTEEIEFSPANAEELQRLQNQLTTVEEERDQLHQTIELQKKEIEKLRESSTSTEAKSVQTNDEAATDLTKEIEKLKLEVFEKDSEIAAMKESALDDSHWADTSKVAAEELEQAQQELAERNDEISNLREELSTANATTETEREKKTLLVNELEEAKATVAKMQLEIDAAKESISNDAEMTSVISKKDEEILRLKEEIETLSIETKQVNADLYAAKGKLEELTASKEDAVKNAVTKAASDFAAKDEELANLRQQLEAANATAEEARVELASVKEGESQTADDFEARLASNAAAKDEEIARLQQELQAAASAAEEAKVELSSARSELEEANVANALLKGEIQSASGSEAQLEELKTSLFETEAKLNAVTEAAMCDQEEAEKKIQSLQAELESVKETSESYVTASASLEDEINLLRQDLETQKIEHAKILEEEIAKVKTEHEVTSMSSGEKIDDVSPPDTPSAVADTAETFSTPRAVEETVDVANDDDDDDGWGDDWGSDDDL